MTVIESILRDLHELPNPKLVDVARYVHALNPKSAERRLADLSATAGWLTLAPQPAAWTPRREKRLKRPSAQKPTVTTTISANGLLLDSNVVTRHFRGGRDLLHSLDSSSA